MSRVRVMTDSVAGIPRNLAEEYHINVVPAANIIFNGHSYIDGVTLSAMEAYELIRKDPDRFTTSALTPGYFLEEYRKISTEAEEILHVALSSELSANYKTACLAAETLKEELPEVNLRIFDSKTVAGAQGLIVLAAARAATQEMDIDHVADIAEQTRQKTRGFMMLDTLRYVYRTGRMSKTASRIVSLLNIKPINRMTDEGILDLVDRVRKREDGYRKLIELIKMESGTDDLHFMIMHAAAPEVAKRFSELLRQQFNCLSLIISEYSPVMGYGAGPGALFIGFHPELNLLK